MATHRVIKSFFGLATDTLNARNKKFFWCPCMVINVSVQYNGGLLPDIILLTQCDYHNRGTRLNAMKFFFVFAAYSSPSQGKNVNEQRCCYQVLDFLFFFPFFFSMFKEKSERA